MHADRKSHREIGELCRAISQGMSDVTKAVDVRWPAIQRVATDQRIGKRMALESERTCQHLAENSCCLAARAAGTDAGTVHTRREKWKNQYLPLEFHST